MKGLSNYIASAAVMVFFASAGTSLLAFGASDSTGSDTVLIVPARPAVLQFAFDLAEMRDITIVSFRGKVNAEKALIHVWQRNKWQYVAYEDFCSLRFAGRPPKTAIVIGDDQTVPKTLLQDMAWPCKIERMQTLNAADLLNGMDKHFIFSSREWKRLADSYGLKLEDVNEPKRSFNPYNIPRSKMPLESYELKQGKDEAPPAVLIEKSKAQTVKNAAAPDEKPWIK